MCWIRTFFHVFTCHFCIFFNTAFISWPVLVGCRLVLLNFEVFLNYYSVYKSFVRCVFFKSFPCNLVVCFFYFLNSISFAKLSFCLLMIDLTIFSFYHCALCCPLKIPVHIRIQNFCPVLSLEVSNFDFTFYCDLFS